MSKGKALVPKLRFPEFEIGLGWEAKKIGGMLGETLRSIALVGETKYCLVTVKRRYGGLVSRGILQGKEIKVTSQFLVNTGDFLISKRQIVHDACGVVPRTLDGSVVSNEYSVLTAKAGCSIDFINWFSQQPCVSASFLECSVGIVIEKMLFKLNLWLKKEFLFPSFPEQQKIADCLSSVDELIAAQARKLDALKTHKKGLTQQLFPRYGETQPRLRFPEFQNAGKWKKTTLGVAATFFNGRAYKQDELLESGKYTVLRVGNFFTSKTWYYSDLELDETKYCDNGDLLYAWSASFGPRIWCGEKTIYHYHIWKVVESRGIDRRFLFITLENETEKMKAESANGLGIMHITKGTIEGWETTFPTMPEQQRIADCLTSLDDLIATQTQKLQALKTHKKGLMQQLFPSVDAVAA